MEGSSSSSHKPIRKMKFLPKMPPKKEPMIIAPKTEPDGTATESVIDSKLLNLVKQAEDGPGQRRPKIEKDAAPMQVAFGNVNPSTAIKSFGIPHSAQKNQDTTNKIEEYVDPWNYDGNYPITTPLRLPHMGNPEVLNEKEFGESSSTYDESPINPAQELGLKGDITGEMFFYQFGASLPSSKQHSAAGKGKEIKDKTPTSHGKGLNLEEMPPGFMGKLLVYKTGAVKLKVGDTLFNVSPGVKSTSAGHLMGVNTEEKLCCVLGELTKRAVVTPDLDNILKSLKDL